ncbi:MAG TPA: S1/P1 nuclease [Gemmataceae bacterium]|jgi:hypothetical protein|nr:S1/P1 nuclease [Gemmataceae bacterium]
MRKVLLISSLVLVFLGGGLRAWWTKGHGTIAEAATGGLPESMPAFFRAGGKHFAHLAAEPDQWKNRQTKFLYAAESPNHYLDFEYLEGNKLPPDRYQAIQLMTRLHQKPDFTGMLPYAIMEEYERLAIAFSHQRAEPENETIKMKCLVYAGILSHYTGDCMMPLHTTKDYDGKKNDKGGFSQKGIHAKIDGFPEKNGFTAEEIGRGLLAEPKDDVWVYVQQRIQESRTFIEKSYRLDAAGAFEKATPESRQFIMERCRAGAQFTMDMWLNAWLKSAKMPPSF